MISFVISVVAWNIDFHHADIIAHSGCFAPNTNTTWGYSEMVNHAKERCPFVESATCLCAATNTVTVGIDCFAYDLSHGTDCGTLYTVYRKELIISAAIGVSLSFLCLVNCVFFVCTEASGGFKDNEVVATNHPIDYSNTERRPPEPASNSSTDAYLIEFAHVELGTYAIRSQEYLDDKNDNAVPTAYVIPTADVEY